ncbi:MAG TPA: TolC family protein [Dongiaceae bacterium]|nr:TolC family protein [Dongiaceae bacterium]
MRAFPPPAAALLVAAFLSVPAARAAAGATEPAPPPAPVADFGATPLTFEAACALAVADNLDYRAARLGRDLRAAEVRTAGLAPNPEFSFETSDDTPHRTFSLDLPIEIGKRGSRVALARETATLADVDDRAALLALRRRVRGGHYGLLAATESARLARAAFDAAGRVREAAEARFETGAAPRIEVMQATLGVGRAQADVHLAEADRRAALAEFNALFARPPEAPVTLAGDLGDAPALPSAERAALLAGTANADLRAAERAVAIEDRRLEMLKRDRYPTPVLSVGALYDAPDEFEDPGLRAAIAIGVPLFSRHQGEIDEAQVRRTQASLRQQALERAIEARAGAAVGRAQAQAEQALAYRTTLLPTAEEIGALAEESYRLGRATLLTLLEAQRSLRDVRHEAIAAQVSLQSALADLEDVLGTPLE